MVPWAPTGHSGLCVIWLWSLQAGFCLIEQFGRGKLSELEKGKEEDFLVPLLFVKCFNT